MAKVAFSLYAYRFIADRNIQRPVCVIFFNWWYVLFQKYTHWGKELNVIRETNEG